MPVVDEIIAVLEQAYPPVLAENWDTGIGLTCGDRTAPVSRLLLAVDVDDAVVAQAESIGAELVITHHPLLFRPVQSVAADTTKGSLVHRLIRGGIAHFCAHTNADKAIGGVNDALAAAVGLTDLRPLVPDRVGLLPAGHPQAGRTGTGRIGMLLHPVELAEFARQVATSLPATVSGVRAGGPPDRRIRTVAVCGGAGDSELAAAAASGVDAYLTSDLRHHVVAEHLAREGAPAVVEVAHWAGEWPWLHLVDEVITAAMGPARATGTLTTTVSQLRTDPWTVHRGSGRPAG